MSFVLSLFKIAHKLLGGGGKKKTFSRPLVTNDKIRSKYSFSQLWRRILRASLSKPLLWPAVSNFSSFQRLVSWAHGA